MEVCVDSVESAVNAFRGGKSSAKACCNARTAVEGYDMNN